VKSLEGRVNWI